MRIKRATAGDLRDNSHDLLKAISEDRVTFAVFQWNHLVACLGPIPRTKKFAEVARQAPKFKSKPKSKRKRVPAARPE